MVKEVVKENTSIVNAGMRYSIYKYGCLCNTCYNLKDAIEILKREGYTKVKLEKEDLLTYRTVSVKIIEFWNRQQHRKEEGQNNNKMK